ncbi:MAG: GEVED domain-containing protein [Bacteroidota bacterium]
MSENYIKKGNSSKNLNPNFYKKSPKNNRQKNYFYGLLFFVFSVLNSQFSFAQNAQQMLFSTSTGVSLNNMTGSTQIVAAAQDFTASGIVTFPFTFRYCGVDYTQFSASSNGLMRLGGTAVSTTDTNNINTQTLLLAPCFDDMHTATTGKVHAVVTGTAPNRILTVEWLFANYADRNIAYTKTVQVVLEETTNIIHFTYGANTNSTSLVSATIGINNTTALFQCVTTTTNTASTTANNSTTVFPASGRRYTWTPPIPTITSFTPTSVCASSGELITITGTNLSSATGITPTAISAGGTALSSISSPTTTTAIGTVGAGTTGTISITTVWGTATSAGTLTVNPLPAAPGNPTSNSPQCASPGVTITRSGTPAAGISWYWQTSPTGTSTANNSSTAYNATTSGTYYIRAQNDVTGCWSATSGSIAIVISATPTTAITPAPANAATAVCYAGSGAVTSVSWAATAGATSYDVYFGAGALPGTLTANVATNSYTCGTLAANTTYYWTVVAKNACGSASSTTWSFTTGNAPCASCTSTSTGSAGYITSFSTTSGTSNITNNASGYSATGYGDFTIKKVTQFPSYTVNFSTTLQSTNGFNIWVDWNDDGTFNTAAYPTGERMYNSGGSQVSSATGSFTVPAGATSGNHRMRIRCDWGAGVTNPSPCGSINNGETEDYTFTVVPLPPCVTPTAQPTALILTPSTNSIAGSFTAASPAPDNYLVVYNTTGVQPTPVDGTAYTVGGAVPGGTAGDIDGNTTFNITGLSSNTLYYIYVFSYNSLCSGGPAYYNPTPITGSTTTLPPNYCTSTGSTVGDGIRRVIFNTIDNTPAGTAVNVTYTNYTAVTTTVMKSSSYNLSVYINTGGGFTNYQRVYIDWNIDGDFLDAGETFSLGSVTNSTNGLSGGAATSITVPAGASTGPVRMRIQSKYNDTTVNSCQTGFDGETEDYTLNVIDNAPCVTPTAQPTNLSLTPTGTTISGSFTAASPVPNNYLVVYNTTGTTPTPTNGTTYTAGSAVTGGTVGDADNNTTFTVTGLSTDTLYYFFVFSYNSSCTGGPLYYNTTPLTGNETTLGATYCAPTTESPSGLYIDSVAFVGTLNDVSNTSGYTGGFQDFSALPNKAKQAQSSGINLICNASPSRGRWKAWVDWNKDGDFLDAGETVYNPGAVAGRNITFGFVVPAAQTPGLYTIRVRVYNLTSDNDYSLDFTACENFTDGFFSDEIGEAEDYRFQVVASCASLITSVTGGTTCGTGTVNLAATGTGGTGFKWYSALTGGTLLATTATGSWTTPSISTTTTYYVTSYSGTCESLVRTAITATVSPTPTLSFTPSTPTVCGENSIVTLTASGDKETVYLVNENFEAGALGVFSNVNNDSNTGGKTVTYWQNKTSTYVPAGYVWYPAVASGFGTNKFALANSDPAAAAGGPPNAPVENSLTLTSSVSSATFLNLYLKLDMYYSRYSPDGTTYDSGGALPTTYTDDLTVQVSTNGGTGWTTINQIIADIGYGTSFQTSTYDLSAYINQANLKIRFRHRSWAGSGWLPGGVAVDNIQLYGERPLTSTFSWTGGATSYSDAACTVAYTPGVSPAITTIYLKPTLAQLQSGNFTFTATTTLSNGCSASQPITVTNNSKVWQTGGTTDWNTASNWLPLGVPSATNCVIIPNNSIISGTAFNAYAYNLNVKTAPGVLTIQSGNTLTVTDVVTVDTGGTLTIENNASLIQVNNVTNVGNVISKRNATINTELDYVYWSSPVVGQVIDNIASPSLRRIYTWQPTGSTANGATGGTGTGIYVDATGSSMALAKGYIAQPTDGFTGTLNAQFTGVPNNGNISFTVSRGSYQGAPYNGTNGTQITNISDNYNLTGNPYPSSISANQFLVNNSAVIQDGIQVWTHGTAISSSTTSPFYGSYIYNYSPNDFLKINLTGNNSGVAALDNYKVGSGQAFFVSMIDGAAGSGVISFTNSLRSNTYGNSTFYRDSQDVDYDNIERHRIWLDIVGANQTQRSLIGYIEGATDGEDTLYDFHTYVASGVLSMYSLINGSIADIQGKSLPFNENDIVPLGYHAPSAGSYTIGIGAVDGLFLGSQKIFLEDKLLNVLHDLRAAPYVFNSEAGIIDDRFVLRYTDTYLGTDQFDLTNSVKIVTNDRAMVYSSNENIQNIVVYDLLGRKIDSYDNINNKQFTLKNLNRLRTTLIMKITLESGIIVTEKFIF